MKMFVLLVTSDIWQQIVYEARKLQNNLSETTPLVLHSLFQRFGCVPER